MRTMTDEEIDRLLFGTMEAECVRRLMAGNDAQCFTTAQYVEVRDNWIAEVSGCTRPPEIADPAYMQTTGRKQLRAFPLVVETAPDVWTLRSLIKVSTQ